MQPDGNRIQQAYGGNKRNWQELSETSGNGGKWRKWLNIDQIRTHHCCRPEGDFYEAKNKHWVSGTVLQPKD